MKKQLGWAYIGVILTVFTANLLILIFSTVSGIVSKLRKKKSVKKGMNKK
jgi:hypothetical protein